MNKEEKTLSDKIETQTLFPELIRKLDVKDVKEFIRELKEELSREDYAYCGIAEEIIDKLAGDSLK